MIVFLLIRPLTIKRLFNISIINSLSDCVIQEKRSGLAFCFCRQLQQLMRSLCHQNPLRRGDGGLLDITPVLVVFGLRFLAPGFNQVGASGQLQASVEIGPG